MSVDVLARLIFDFLVATQFKWLAVVLFVLGSRILRKIVSGRRFDFLFFLLNVGCVCLFFWDGTLINKEVWISYLAIVLSFYVILWILRNSLDDWWVIPFSLPIIFLVIVKVLGIFFGKEFYTTVEFIGISYMALRLSKIVSEVRNQSTPFPSVSSYLAFAFFLPTLTVGPINSYANFVSIDKRSYEELWDSFVRIFIGLGKYQVLGVILSRLNFSNFIFDDYHHSVFDLLVGSSAYYLFLYCNFSGFCDIMIGISSLAGFKVSENFNSPLLSRNIKEFWNRWHITLSEWVRDFIFTPLSKKIVVIWGAKRINEIVAISSLIVFSIVGLWHGIGINFLLFGVMHAFGLICVHYFGFYFKKKYPSFFKIYSKSKLAHFAAWMMTAIYVSITFGIFQLSLEQLRALPSVIVFL